MPTELTRRQAVMARSRKLGHCVCNPKIPCPCPTLIEHNVCTCAGERLPVKQERVALTRHVRKAGCASKIGQAELLGILGGLPPVDDPNVLIGTAAGDDAGVYRLNDALALVQTVDVFTPCVDDPYLFGQIAAANSLSDVYAMGGKPLTALSIVGFPIDELDGGVMQAMLRGGMDKLEEAGCALIGGHSINDEEIKCGFAVTGVIDPKRAVARDSVKPGDVLVLTKPLGTGILSFAAQLGLVSGACMAEAGAWMAALNKDAADLMLEHGANGCTDVTGFGLAGHLVAMVRGSGVSVEIDLSAVPVFAMAAECIRHDVLGGAVDRNQAYAASWVVTSEDADLADLAILYDPQTSGGLLISMPEDQAKRFIADMETRGHTATCVIGRVRDEASGPSEGRVTVTNARMAHFVGSREPIDLSRKPVPAEASAMETCCCDEPPEIACCDSPPTIGTMPRALDSRPAEEKTDMDALALFRDFMKEANSPGLIDGRNKKLMAIALSIAHHCHPCLKIHLQSAVKMGIQKPEIDEAASLAISFGGCTAMMFYKEVCQELGLE